MYPNYYSYLGSLSAGLTVVILIVAALIIVANWKIYEKAGVPGVGVPHSVLQRLFAVQDHLGQRLVLFTQSFGHYPVCRPDCGAGDHDHHRIQAGSGFRTGRRLHSWTGASALYFHADPWLRRLSL